VTGLAVAFWVAAGLYAASCVLYFGFLVGAPEGLRRAARLVLAIAFVAHTVEMCVRGVARLHPAASPGEALGFLAWLLTGAYLLAQLKKPLDAVGAFVAPAVTAMLIAARLTPSGTPNSGIGTLGRVHISLAMAGVSIFALAAALAVAYLLEDRQLRRKRLGRLVKRGTALETLDRLAHRCVQVGFPLFTIALVTGAMWSSQRAEGIRVEYAIAALAWAAFAVLLIARSTVGWRGRRAAVMTLAGFSSALVVLVVYLARAAGGG
jgi:ABC-type uncharacterized transport system permease subunit